MAGWVASTATGRPTRQTLAAVIAYWPARGRASQLSQAEMAEVLGVCTRTVRRWTKELEAAGLLEVTRHDADNDPYTGRLDRQTNRYWPVVTDDTGVVDHLEAELLRVLGGGA